MRIYINAGHSIDRVGAIHNGHEENVMAIALRDKALMYLYKIPGVEIMAVPDELNLKETIAWINETATKDDIAFSIHFNSNNNKSISGTEAYYSNDREKEMAIIFADKVAKAGGLKNRGPKHDSQTWVGSLGWLRKLKCDSVLVETCYLTSPTDMSIYSAGKTAEGFTDAVRDFLNIKDELPTVEDLQKEISGLKRLVAILINYISSLINKQNNG